MVKGIVINIDRELTEEIHADFFRTFVLTHDVALYLRAVCCAEI
jgi:hypothetical protein